MLELNKLYLMDCMEGSSNRLKIFYLSQAIGDFAIVIILQILNFQQKKPNGFWKRKAARAWIL